MTTPIVLVQITQIGTEHADQVCHPAVTIAIYRDDLTGEISYTIGHDVSHAIGSALDVAAEAIAELQASIEDQTLNELLANIDDSKQKN